MIPYPLILLCAGDSSRMGQAKGLIPVGKKTWLEHQVASFRQAGGKDLIVILGAQALEYFMKLPWLKAAKPPVYVAINPNPARGQFSSVQIGLRVLLGLGFPGGFILPVDVPAPGMEAWHTLSAGLRDGVQVGIPVFQGKNGHPVLLSAALCEQLVSGPENGRLNALISGLSEGQIAHFSVEDEAVIQNLNTPESFKNWALKHCV